MIDRIYKMNSTFALLLTSFCTMNFKSTNWNAKITEFVPRKVHHICILKNIMSGVFEYSFIMGAYANYQLYLLQKDVIVKLI